MAQGMRLALFIDHFKYQKLPVVTVVVKELRMYWSTVVHHKVAVLLGADRLRDYEKFEICITPEISLPIDQFDSNEVPLVRAVNKATCT